jgi:tetratricopeptide (TPR) repeat protein
MGTKSCFPRVKELKIFNIFRNSRLRAEWFWTLPGFLLESFGSDERAEYSTAMFPAFPKSLRIPVSNLLAGFALAVSVALPTNAQTLADIQDLMQQGNLGRALEQADRYIAAQPKDAQGPFAKGLILTSMGRATEAIAVFTELTENFPELPEPHNNLAALYAGQKQYDRARIALEMAIRVDPDYAMAHENLGDIYAKLASQSYARAARLDASGTTAPAKLRLAQELVDLSAQPARQ